MYYLLFNIEGSCHSWKKIVEVVMEVQAKRKSVVVSDLSVVSVVSSKLKLKCQSFSEQERRKNNIKLSFLIDMKQL